MIGFEGMDFSKLLSHKEELDYNLVSDKFGIHYPYKTNGVSAMLNLNSVMIGTKQSKVLTAFYEKVIGKPPEHVDDEYGFYGWQVGSVYLGVLEHSEMGGKTKDPGRVMLNFETSQVQEEFERIKALGGVVIQAPYQIGEEWIATLADPDGNYFQLINPMGA